MSLAKYDPRIAQREIKLIRSPKGDSRNIRILLARGMRHEVAVVVVEQIRQDSNTNPEAYVAEILRDESNLDPKYLAWREDEDIFNPELWAKLQEAEIEYTTPIRRRLRKRAIAKEEELLVQRAMQNETTSFWRASPRKFSTSNLG